MGKGLSYWQNSPSLRVLNGFYTMKLIINFTYQKELVSSLRRRTERIGTPFEETHYESKVYSAALCWYPRTRTFCKWRVSHRVKDDGVALCQKANC